MTGSRLALAAYRAAASVARHLPLRGKLGLSLDGRESPAWWEQMPPAEGRRIWLHAASVGEMLAAEPVIRRLLAGTLRLDVVLSYSSPSIAGWALGWPVAGSGFAPAENPDRMRQAFAALAPDLLLFSRSDLWPEMLLAARDRGVPVAVCGGTVRPGSWRRRWPARSFLSDLYQDLRFVGAVTGADHDRWIQLGASPAITVVTGDPRHDQVLERITRMDAVRALGTWPAGGPLLVAGSLEEGEEPIVLGALALVRRSHPAARLLIVPHDPDAASLARITAHARRAGIAVQEFSPRQPTTAACVVMTTRGILPDLYAAATVSYVGGGFRGKLHAVIEPAAYGLPVVIGPDFRGVTDAEPMVESGGAFVLPRRGAARSLAVAWRRWIENPAEKHNAGLNARRELQQGAAALTARYLLELLPAGR